MERYKTFLKGCFVLIMAGLLFISSAYAACTGPAGNEGEVIYNDNYNVVQFCDGTYWVSMTSNVGWGGAGCSAPTGSEGTLNYNDDYNALQYCDGTQWVAIGKFGTPLPFDFIDQNNALVNSFVISNSVVISEIPATPVSVSGDGSPQISIDGGAWVNNGTISNGQSLRVRLTSSATGNTTSSVVVNVGGITDQWNVTTEYSVTLTNSTHVVIQSLFTVGEWSSSINKHVIIPSGVTIGSTSPGTPAIRTGTGWGGSLIIDNAGSIQGAGGVANGGNGGTGFLAEAAGVLLNNSGTIYGGGGGGGKGGNGGAGTYSDYQRSPPTGYHPWSIYSYNIEVGQSTGISRVFYGGSNLGDYNAGKPPPYINIGAWQYLLGPYVTQYGSGSGTQYAYQVARQRITPIAGSSSGGIGGDGGRGRGYDGANAAGAAGTAGGTNAGTGGTGGTGGTWGANGAAGTAGTAGNNGAGAGGSAGGAAGPSIGNPGNVTYYSLSPNAFSFTDQTNAALSTLITSNTITLSGFDVAVPVSVTGAGSPQISIAGGAWATSGTISSGQSLRVRLTSSASAGTTSAVTIDAGGVTSNWSVTTVLDTTPNAFSFTDQTDVALSTLITSNSITISGINAATSISVSGSGSPQVSINGGAWTTTSTISNGQSLQVRLTSDTTGGVISTATIDINGVTSDWSVTTVLDTIPTPFSFTDQTNVAASTLITSNSITISGVNAGTAAGISGDGSPQISINGGAWTNGGTITNGQSLQARLTSNAAGGVANIATIDVGGVTTDWSVTTLTDTTPNAFTFTDQTNVAANTLITSNSLTISGINASTLASVSGAGSPQISINGGAWGTSGSITNGQSLQVRLTSSGSYSTARSATINVGGVTDNWSVTTSAPPCGGTSYGGYCWYRTATYNAENCNDACSGHGGVNMTGTRDFAGSGGNLANCVGVVTAMGYSNTGTQDGNYGNPAESVGCSQHAAGMITRCINYTTTATGSSFGAYRYCACNN